MRFDRLVVIVLLLVLPVAFWPGTKCTAATNGAG